MLLFIHNIKNIIVISKEVVIITDLGSIYIKFGKRLAALRKSKKLSQAKIASELQMAQSTYALYEVGKRKITLELIELFSAYFEVSPTYLVTGSTALDKINDEEQLYMQKYRVLDERGKKNVLDTLEREYEFSQQKENRDISDEEIS